MPRFLPTVLAVLFLSAPALAAESCVKPAVLEAEKAVRLHTELLISALTCQQGSDGSSLPQRYSAFTKQHQHALQSYERTLIDYYRTTRKGNPERQFDTLRTNLANAVSQYVANVSAPAYCQSQADRLLTAASWGPETLPRYVGTASLLLPPQTPACAGGEVRSAAK
jgi:hypothetical protein